MSREEAFQRLPVTRAGSLDQMKSGFEITLVPGHRFARLGGGNRYILSEDSDRMTHELAPGGCPDRRPLVFREVEVDHETIFDCPLCAGMLYGDYP